MTQFESFLGTDFDGNRTDDVDDVIYGGYDHAEHRERVPGLTALLADHAAPDRERYLACLALVAWGEPVGYQSVQDVTREPKAAPWYDLVVDRKFSVDSSYGKFSEAAADGRELAEEKGSSTLRLETFRSLIRIADREYFEERLGDYLEESVVRACLPEIREVIARALRSIGSGAHYRFDLATQLVDLANSVVTVDEELAVDLITRVLHAVPGDRTLVHAVTAVHRAKGPAGKRLAELLSTMGSDKVRSLLTPHT
ncbi:hypothetical protein [Streptomyces yangpuensis]|uniref:hypothetical protein n=1 Tax=Streptomyces yangpuensis TaxID=1648182 RepID=UPI003717F163